MNDDLDLLRRYACRREEAAFAELVARHIGFVHAAALRQVNGDAHLAADVTQMVFTDLARKAAALTGHRVLSGWLFTSTRYAAAKAVRGEQRRRTREEEARLMEELNGDHSPALDWERVRPVLDRALAGLGQRDREAILLRFFEGRDFAAVGARLELSANTARMRVERALDKLRAQLSRQGITSTTAALATVLAQQALAAAPAGLASSVTATAVAGGGATAGGAFLIFMNLTKLQMGTAAALLVAGGTGLVTQASANAELRADIAAAHSVTTEIAALQADNKRLRDTAEEVVDLRKDDGALEQLRQQSEALAARLRAAEAARQAAAARASTVVLTPVAATTEVVKLNEVDRQPVPTLRAAPQYPFEMRRAGISGEVMVEFLIDPQGNVRNARALKSSQQEFETAAVEAVAKWKFNPAAKGGRNVITVMQVPIVFTLNNGTETPKSPTWF
jgi:RNA polymerase sigma factor (sigma-70 family)